LTDSYILYLVNSIYLKALFSVRYRRQWRKSQSHVYEDIKTINTDFW